MIPNFLLDRGYVSLGASPGLSDSALPIGLQTDDQLVRSPSIMTSQTEGIIFAKLEELFFTARERNWDGNDSDPVSPTALSYALQFLSTLPSNIPVPEISVDLSDFVALDWDNGARQNFTVKVGRDGTLYYAGLFGHEPVHGSLPLRQDIDAEIAEGINRAIREP